MMRPLGVVGGFHSTSAKYGLLTLKAVIVGGVAGTVEGYKMTKFTMLSMQHKSRVRHNAIIYQGQGCQGWETQMRVILSLAPPLNAKYRE